MGQRGFGPLVWLCCTCAVNSKITAHLVCQTSTWALSNKVTNWFQQGLARASAFICLRSPGSEHCCYLLFPTLLPPLLPTLFSRGLKGQVMVTVLTLRASGTTWKQGLWTDLVPKAHIQNRQRGVRLPHCTLSGSFPDGTSPVDVCIKKMATQRWSWLQLYTNRKVIISNFSSSCNGRVRMKKCKLYKCLLYMSYVIILCLRTRFKLWACPCFGSGLLQEEKN